MKKTKKNCLFQTVSIVIYLFLIGTFNIFSQQKNILNEKVSVDFNQVEITEILNHLSNDFQFDYAFNTDVFEENKISIHQENQPLKNVLDEICLKLNTTYKYKNGFLTFKGKPKQRKEIHYLKGIVVRSDLKTPISNVIISEKQFGKIAKSNTSGNFSIEVEGPIDIDLDLSFEKNGFSEKNIHIILNKSKEIKLLLNPKLKEQKSVIGESSEKLKSDIKLNIEDIELKKVENYFIKELNTLNGKQSVKPFQISLIPTISTNGKDHYKSINSLSFNVIAGYAASLNGFELGLNLNILKYNGIGTQIAGVGNIIGGNFYGIQLAGGFNVTSLKTTGFQIAGGMNKSNRGVKGVQFAGAINISNNKLVGIQNSSFFNATKSGIGIQLSGMVNVVADDFTGAQIAGVVNKISGKLKGIQFAGMLNNGNVHGIQAAPFNYGEKNKGLQVGIFNRTVKMKGIQLGFVNVAEEYEKGFPIGIISIVENGKQVIETSYSTINHSEVAFKSGVQKFYGIFTSGNLNHNNFNRITFGYGFGTEFNLNKYLVFNFEKYVKRFHVNKEEGGKYWLRVSPNLSLNILNKFGIKAGVNYNYMFKNDILTFNSRNLTYKISNNAWIDYTFGLWINL
ncbi:LA_2272 family surface repeat-containing protein [Aureivirga marina]|uniref:LA_2272 family surface repeat-containing protein n=1 Tax=Aureivirga marina TaxID=1182451 RepID=UPI0018CB3E82|nr:hypothetical protein [Aureivirga marina]